jgi:phosphoglycolate phosphatase-like HAD superfamily hydrolase
MYRRCGVSTSDDILVAVAKRSPEDQAVANAIIEEMEAEGARTAQLAPGVVELAKWLKSHDIPIALVTRNSKTTVDVFVSKLWEPAGLQAFTPAISRNDPYPPKPDPGSLFGIAKQWGITLPSDELIMVGDSPSNDVQLGK